jgi:hypothetical protein
MRPILELAFHSLVIASRPQTPGRSMLGAAGHIILTSANQLMVMGLKETLLALVRDLFTFSSKVIKRFIIV